MTRTAGVTVAQALLLGRLMSDLRRRHFLAFASSLALVPFGRALALAASPTAGSFRRDEKDPRWVHGIVTVGTAPADVWKRLEGVPAWASMFSDIKKLEVKKHEGSTWLVRMATLSFDCGEHDYKIALEPAQRIADVRILVPGANALARVIVSPTETPAESMVTYSLFVEATGIMGWFVSEKVLREKQESMVRRYLDDFSRVFSAAKG